MDIVDEIKRKYPIAYCTAPCTQSIGIAGTAADILKNYLQENYKLPHLNCFFEKTEGLNIFIDLGKNSDEFIMTIPDPGKNIVLYFQGAQAENSVWWLLYCVLYSRSGDQNLKTAIAALDGKCVNFVCISHAQQAMASMLLSHIKFYLSDSNGEQDRYKKRLYSELLKIVRPFIEAAPSFSNRPISAGCYEAMFNWLGIKRVFKNENIKSIIERLYGDVTIGAELSDYENFVIDTPAFRESVNKAAQYLKQEICSVRLAWVNSLLNISPDENKVHLEDNTKEVDFQLSRQKLKEVFRKIDTYYKEKVKAELEKLFLTAVLTAVKKDISDLAGEAQHKLGEMLYELNKMCLLDTKQLDKPTASWNNLAEQRLDDVPATDWNEEDFGTVLSKLHTGSCWYNKKYGSKAFVLCSQNLYANTADDPTGTNKYPVLMGDSCIWVAFSQQRSVPGDGG